MSRPSSLDGLLTTSVQEQTVISLDEELRARSAERKQKNLWRTQRVVSSAQEADIFCSNDYLGVAARDLLALDEPQTGFGASASRLISGTTPAHAELETRLASWMRTESARYFATGYQANVGLLSSLISRGDVVFSDALNHASLIDGIRLSRAEIHVFAHADLAQLEQQLRAHAGSKRGMWIVTDAIFSMDGDVALIDDIVELSEKYGARIYMDEAHAIGVLGPQGRGLAASRGLSEHVDVIVGTCGKSMGSAGAFVVGSEVLCDYVYNAARSFVFSTAPPPIICDAVRRSVSLLEAGELQRELWSNLETFQTLLSERGWWRGAPKSPIFPIVLGEEQVAVSVSEQLLARGFFVHPIRPPTVPPGSSRLRVTVCANHSRERLAKLVDAIAEACKDVGCVPKVWSHE